MKSFSFLLGALGLMVMAVSAEFAMADVAPSAESAHALKVGDHAPSFSAHRADRSKYVFDSNHLGKPVVLIFYRGGWCPYCNTQLSEMHSVEPKLRQAGFEVLFLSTDRPELLHASLKDQSIDYTLLSDPDLQAAQAFQIAFHVSDELYAEELKYGVNLEKTTGSSAHALPVPSVFIVDKSGIIRFVYSNPDYRVRLQSDDLWAAARSLKSAPDR